MGGIGQGFAQGAKALVPIAMAGLQMSQDNANFQKGLDADLEWKRAMAGKGPSYEMGASAAQGQEISAIPSSTPTETPATMSQGAGAALGVPTPQFNQSSPIAIPTAPPAAVPNPSSGAMDLLPTNRPSSFMRFPSMGRGAGLSQRSRYRF